MFIKAPFRSDRALTLVEVMVALAIFTIAATILGSLTFYSAKSFAAMTNYAELDRANREAMDLLTREIRQAKQVTGYVTDEHGNSLTVRNGANQLVTLSFDADQQQLVRSVNGARTILLTNCSLLDFRLFQRNPSNANFGVFPAAYENWTQSVKVVQLTWKTGKSLFNGAVNSENIQTARIVIRKHQD